MSSLYNVYRPISFLDVIGQDEIITTLKNQIITKKISQSIMLFGTRGTGKTTCAKIYAKAVNCLNPIEGNPCGKCSNCVKTTTLDILEMDAASNNGVDDIRGILEQTHFYPSEMKYKVFIIDEVHMLSKGAFNALLKTLETPPAHCLFILCTTEINKIPATIISRCMCFEMRRISELNIVNRLRHVCNAEKRKYEESALNIIASNSGGALRDALSILEQAFFISQGEISEANVSKMLGCTNKSSVVELVGWLLRYNVVNALTRVQALYEYGKDMYILSQEIIKVLRDCMLISKSPDIIIPETVEYVTSIKNTIQNISTKVIVKIIRNILEVSNKIKYSMNPITEIEIGIISLSIDFDVSNTNGEMTSNSDLLLRLESVEKHLEKLSKEILIKTNYIVNSKNEESFDNESIGRLQCEKQNHIKEKLLEMSKEDVVLNSIISNSCIHEDNDKLIVYTISPLVNVANTLYCIPGVVFKDDTE